MDVKWIKRINCLNRLSWIIIFFAVFGFMHTTLGLDIRWMLVISFAFWVIAVLIVNQVKTPKAERKDFVKFFVGMVLIFSGSVLGLYVGGYLCLYGGIVQIIHGIKANFEWSTIAFGILRVVGTGPAAVIATALVSNIGSKLASIDEVHQRGKSSKEGDKNPGGVGLPAKTDDGKGDDHVSGEGKA